MELIPIIYTILKIVVVLTILTLSISYIGFKVKQRKGENIIGKDKNATFLEPISKIEIPLPSNPNPIKVYHEAKPKEVEKNRSGSQKKKDEIRRKPSQKDSPKRKAENKRPEPRIQNNRISVLKNLSTLNPKENIVDEIKVKTGKEQIQTLGDDVLEKYVEDGDNDMFTLKVTKKEKPEDNT